MEIFIVFSGEPKHQQCQCSSGMPERVYVDLDCLGVYKSLDAAASSIGVDSSKFILKKLNEYVMFHEGYIYRDRLIPNTDYMIIKRTLL